jgi:biotin operon repressor
MMIDEDRIVGVAMVSRKQLAADLGTSRSGVNSAIRAMIKHGYLVEIPGGFLATRPPHRIKENA